MMNTIINEKMIPFKDLEKKIFSYVCEYGVRILQSILEECDVRLMETRDKKTLRNKGLRRTSIKTVMGEVEYQRTIYETRDGEGHKAWVYLLDQALEMEKIGMYSTNMVEKIAEVVCENSFQTTAQIISSTCGQSVSHGGAWGLVQKLGGRIEQEEVARVKEMDAGEAKGVKEVGLLFEEMDGVWLRMQGRDHKKAPKQEMKVGVTYEGWEADEKDNSRLANKRVIAGMESSKDFHAKREAQIQSVYNPDEIGYRILNGDGGGWIHDPYEPDTVFQLDPFHIEREIKRKLTEKEAMRGASQLYHKGEYEKLLEFLETYATSVESPDKNDKRSKNARELHGYLSNNREGLTPWQEQRSDYPEAPEGIVYKNMGVMENQNCTTITMRMKGGRKRWSTDGANHMAKLLYTKENEELPETIGRYTDELMVGSAIEETLHTLSAAKAPKKDGKGSSYMEIIRYHMPILDTIQTAARKAFRRIV